MKSQYKIFTSPDNDWFIPARRDGKTVTCLCAGHSRADAYRAILNDMGINVPVKEMDLESQQPGLKNW